ILNDFGADEKTLAKRKAFFEKEAKLEAAEKDYRDRAARLGKLREDYLGLKGIQVVSSSLVWDTNEALGGISPLSRFLDAHSFPPGPEKIAVTCGPCGLHFKPAHNGPPFLWFQS